MTDQPNRLAAATHQFSGSLIDRSKPLKFRLDGRIIEAFAGDSVLSAVLAAGIDTVGQRGGWPMALSARFAPPIIPARQAGETQRARPMARVPVTEGADYLTVADPAQRHGLLGRILRPACSLGLKLDGAGCEDNARRVDQDGTAFGGIDDMGANEAWSQRGDFSAELDGDACFDDGGG